MSPASYALRFATGFDGMMMVLSGMNDMAQMQDNLSFMKDFQPLSTKEQEAVKQVTAKKVYGYWNSNYYYS